MQIELHFPRACQRGSNKLWLSERERYYSPPECYHASSEVIHQLDVSQSVFVFVSTIVTSVPMRSPPMFLLTLLTLKGRKDWRAVAGFSWPRRRDSQAMADVLQPVPVGETAERYLMRRTTHGRERRFVTCSKSLARDHGRQARLCHLSYMCLGFFQFQNKDRIASVIQGKPQSADRPGSVSGGLFRSVEKARSGKRVECIL